MEENSSQSEHQVQKDRMDHATIAQMEHNHSVLSVLQKLYGALTLILMELVNLAKILPH